MFNVKEIPMIGASGFGQSPKEHEKSIAYRAGQDAKKRGVKLKNSAIKNLRVGSKQYDDFLAGFDSK